MIRINLGRGEPNEPKKDFLGLQRLPPPLQKAIRRLTADLTLIATYVIAMGLAYVPGVVLARYETLVEARHKQTLKELDNQALAVDEEVKKYTPFKRELDSFEAQKAMVKERLNVIRNLQGGRMLPVTVLDALGQGLPKRVWLSNIHFGMNGDRSNIDVSGRALSSEDISDFVDKLGDSVHMDTVSLGAVASQSFDRVVIKTFSLKILSKPAAADPAERDVALVSE